VRQIPYLELVHPEQLDEATNRLAELAQGATLEGYETRIRHKNGQYRWISWTVVAEGDLLYGVGRDITELHRQRTQRHNLSEMRLQLALEVGRMGAWQWDMVTGQITWWPGMDRLHGLEPGYRLNQVEDYLQFVHPDDLDRVRINLGNNSHGESESGIEYRIVWPDGSIHWLEGRGDIFRNEQGEPELMAGICVDITQRKRTEQDLRFIAQASAELSELVDTEETLRRIAHLAVPHFADWCAVDLLDEQGGLKRVAVAHADPEKVALGYELYECFPPDPAEQAGVWQIIRSGKADLVPEITDELLTRSVTDAEYLAALRQLGLRSYLGVPLTLRGNTLGAIMFVSAESRRIYTQDDLTLAEDIAGRAATAIENARLYRSLKEADRRKDDFLAMLAHELRNPLSPIGAAADLLQLPLSKHQLQDTGNVIARQVKHMSGLVDDLLDVSRVTQGRVTLDRRPVDICQAVSAAVEQVRPLIEKRLHQLTLAIGSGPLFVSGDEKRLVQVIANLLNNAARYTPEGGNIKLSLESQGDFIDIRLTDNGIGMEPELVASAFDLFVQGTRTADRSQGGLGLGLALVKSLVELHEGSVQAFSKGIGQGSSFAVRLQRLAGADATEAPERQQPEQEDRTLKLLVVDDNQDAADMLVMFLQLVGHQVHNCNTPAAALEAVAEDNYDALLLDIGLPGMDGYELARQIRQRKGAQTPLLIAISGYGQDKDRDAANAAGIDHYMVKPVDTEALLTLLQAATP
jgi:signal transduction histidine kinase/PAS domain-containing protein/ActR/RegA family two-component response regulator